MLRACRFAAQLNFKIHRKTLKAIKKLAFNITKISKERIRDEFIKILISDKPSIGLEYMRKTILMKYILSDLYKGFNISQNRFHKYDIYYHNINVCDHVRVKDYRLRLAGLFHDVGKVYAKKDIQNKIEPVFYNHEVISYKLVKKFMKRYKFSNNDIKFISNLVYNHMFYYTDKWSDGAVRRFINKVGADNLENIFILREADRLGSGTKKADCQAIDKFKKRIKLIIEKDSAMNIKDLNINGEDLMRKFNLKPSKQIGVILKSLLEMVLDNPEFNKKSLLLNESSKLLNEINNN